ncbi:MAG: lipase family protein [Candidatus Cloacimonetes bacterium]|nr:lipase family protein [Candidatus Cloacimonadota bacterium]MDY0230586.1 lipase family protein [Candidatus Cloacimonadaceae bacterium]
MRTHLELAKLFKEIDQWDTIGTDTQYRILEYPDEVVIIFCPSNSKADWKINFAFPKKPYKQMPTPFYVHGGFLEEWKKINDFFLKAAAEFDKPITLTGWSYGGAMATLCYEDFWFNFFHARTKMRLITFGAPRVIGAKNFKSIANRFEGAVLYANGSDVVTCVPPAVLGFRHVRKLTRIGDKLGLVGLCNPKKYHHIDGYIKSLGETNE